MNSDIKWYFIGASLFALFISVPEMLDKWSRTQAKRDIIVACYAANRPNCEALWNKVIK